METAAKKEEIPNMVRYNNTNMDKGMVGREEEVVAVVVDCV